MIEGQFGFQKEKKKLYLYALALFFDMEHESRTVISFHFHYTYIPWTVDGFSGVLDQIYQSVLHPFPVPASIVH